MDVVIVHKYQKNELVKGIVTGIEKYGIFVSVGDYTGLIHISEISRAFVKDPNDFAKIGDEIEAEIIDVDYENKKLKLSKKNLNKDFKEIGEGFKPLEEKLESWIKEKI